MLGFQNAHMSIHTNFASVDVKKLYTTSWIPICQEKDVIDKKIYNIDLLDSSVSVTRLSDGSYSVFEDRCPHRGAKLSGGIFGNDCVKCPYHHMEFDCKTSEVVQFLGSPDVNHIKGSLQLYKNKVHDKLVWIYMGSEDEPIFHANELVAINEGTKREFTSIHGYCDVKCNIFDALENLIDNTHISFVHSFGNKMDPEPQHTKRYVDDRGVQFSYQTGSQSIAKYLDMSGKDQVSVYNNFREPCSAMSRVTFAEDMVKCVRVHLLPIGENKTRFFWGLHRNFLTSSNLNPVFEYFMRQTLQEDKVILENLYNPGKPEKQFLTEHDWLIAQYRKRMETHMYTK